MAYRKGRQATADEIASAAGITADTSYRLVDRYGVTYTGTPSHLAVNALIRPDLTPDLDADDNLLQQLVRFNAHRLGMWFTCPYTEPSHAAAFAALPPRRVCELVTHLVNHSRSNADQVGPAALSAYTGYLISDAVDDPDTQIPTLGDNCYQPLSRDLEGDGLLLDITASAPGEEDDVTVRVSLDVRQEIGWDVVADVAVPVAELNDLLRQQRTLSPTVGRWLEHNLALVDEHLSYDASFSYAGKEIDATIVAASTPLYPPSPEPEQADTVAGRSTTTTSFSNPGKEITAEVVAATTALDPAPPGLAEATDLRPARTTIFFVGADETSALANNPFSDQTEAATRAEAEGQYVFTSTVRNDSLRRCP